MSYVYICEQGAVVGVEGNRLQVKYKDGMCLLPIMSMWKDKDYKLLCIWNSVWA